MPTASNRPVRHSGRIIGDRIGENNANNEYDSSAVVANADGSLLERVEDIKDRLAGTTVPTGLPASFHPQRGYHVTKSGTIASAPDMLFDVTGKCEITLMIGEVTSIIATSTSMSINTSTSDLVMAASTQITTDAVGTLYGVCGDIGLGFNAGATPNVDGIVLDVGTFAPIIINDDTIEMNVNSAGTGLVQWDLWYWPLEAGASVAAAA